MAGYTRQDVSNNISNGNTINAQDLDDEFDALQTSFDSTNGHSHDGSSTEGAPITVVGPAQDLVVSATDLLPKTDNTLDLGSDAKRFKSLYLEGNIDITGSIVGYLTTTGNDSRYARTAAQNNFTEPQTITNTAPFLRFTETGGDFDSRVLSDSSSLLLQISDDDFSTAPSQEQFSETSVTFVLSSTNAAKIDPAGTSSGSDTTVITREKGDARYRLDSAPSLPCVGSIVSTGSVGSGSFNIASVTKPGTGSYVVNFTDNISLPYFVLLSALGTNSAAWTSLTSSSISVSTYDSSGTLADASFTVAVIKV